MSQMLLLGRRQFLALVSATAACPVASSAPIAAPAHDVRLHPEFLGRLTSYKRDFELPEWARQGCCRQIRIDGGPMFTACQIESKWDYLFNPRTAGFVGVINAVWTLTNLYANDLEQRLDLIRRAGYNWAWVSYQLGYAFEDEARQRAQVRRLIQLAHQRGIRITAYFSLTSIFTRSAFVKNPESRGWIQENEDGSAVAYAGIPERLMACVNKPGRLEYLKRIAKLAVDDGADDIFYDSIFNRCYCRWCLEGFRQYSNTVLGEPHDIPQGHRRQSFGIGEQSVAGRGADPIRGLFLEYGYYAVACALVVLDAYAKSLNPRITLSANSHQMRFIDDVTDITWSEDSNRKGAYVDGQGRLTTPMGVYAWCQAAAEGHKPIQLTVAPHEYWQLQPPEYYQITTADAASFQCNFVMLAGYAFATRYEEHDPVALRAWEGIGDGLRFIEAHQEFFEDVRPAADIALYQSQATRMMKSLKNQAVRGEPLVQDFFGAGHPVRLLLDRQAVEGGAEVLTRNFRLIVLPDVLAISDEEIQLLKSYVGHGGRLIVTSASGRYTSFLTKRKSTPWSHPVPGVTITTREDLHAPSLREMISKVLGRPPFAELAGNGYQFAIPNRQRDRLIVHLLNYNDAEPSINMRAEFSALGNANIADVLKPGCTARWVSPDDSAAINLDIKWSGTAAQVMIPRLRVSGLLVFEPRT
jgi:hypothetical protein